VGLPIGVVFVCGVEVLYPDPRDSSSEPLARPRPLRRVGQDQLVALREQVCCAPGLAFLGKAELELIAPLAQITSRKRCPCFSAGLVDE